MARIDLDLAGWRDAHEATGIAYVCAFASGASHDDTTDLKVRVFTPSDGIIEDPATGSAVAAIGGLMALERRFGRYRVTQGAEIGRPSELSLAVSEQAVHVGGKAVAVGRGFLDL